MNCRHCNTELTTNFIDLGASPLSNSYLSFDELNKPESWYPLKVFVCENCWLVQTADFAGADTIFNEEYAYFSSFSSTWVEHAKTYVEMAISRFGLGSNSLVFEVAANDGYLLQHVQNRQIPCIGIEPTKSTANAARKKGLNIIEQFFGEALAAELVYKGFQADLIAANNVLAHVPNINDFVRGFEILLKPQGIATFEFPHLTNLILENQFDTIYHEHYSYLSLNAVRRIFQANGLDIFDVETLTTHGGSLRVFAQRIESGSQSCSERVLDLIEYESKLGITKRAFYEEFEKKIIRIKRNFLFFLLDAQQNSKKIAAYGAAAKGNTLLNYCGIRSDLINFVVDKSPSKQNKYLPGSHISICNEDRIRELKPDYIVILPWNLTNEIMKQLDYVRSWNCKFLTAIPDLRIF